MFHYAGDIKYACNNCGYSDNVEIKDFEIVGLGCTEQGMGTESIDSLEYVFNCPECDKEISLIFEVAEYPVEALNHVINRSSGASTEGEPYFEYLPEDDSDDDDDEQAD